MKLPNHMMEARGIGADSYCLQHYDQLPKTASKKSQVQALNDDLRWQEQHHTEITLRIKRLIHDIRDDS